MARKTIPKWLRMKKLESGCCELCGSQMGLEVHHIIPVVCGGTDDERNLIALCRGCHAKLTPKDLLSMMARKRSAAEKTAYINMDDFYSYLDFLLKHGDPVGSEDIFDAAETARTLWITDE